MARWIMRWGIPSQGKGRKAPTEAEAADLRLATLEQDLQATKEYLERTIEELGASNEAPVRQGHHGPQRVGPRDYLQGPAARKDRAAEDQWPSQAQSGQPVPAGRTILLIDDDPDVRRVGSRMLDLLGFKVLTAADGQEGLEVFQGSADEITCVILDLTMPEMGGEEVFGELRRLRPDVRVILSSGFNAQEMTQQFVGKGLAGFIQKPYRVANLQEILNRVLG